MITYDELKQRFKYEPETGKFYFTMNLRYVRYINKAGEVAGHLDESTNTIKISIDGKRYSASRLAWLYHYGEWPKGRLSYFNNNSLDTRIHNLILKKKDLQ